MHPALAYLVMSSPGLTIPGLLESLSGPLLALLALYDEGPLNQTKGLYVQNGSKTSS